jgi:hypothetical protein
MAGMLPAPNAGFCAATAVYPAEVVAGRLGVRSSQRAMFTEPLGERAPNCMPLSLSGIAPAIRTVDGLWIAPSTPTLQSRGCTRGKRPCRRSCRVVLRVCSVEIPSKAGGGSTASTARPVVARWLGGRGAVIAGPDAETAAHRSLVAMWRAVLCPCWPCE